MDVSENRRENGVRLSHRAVSNGKAAPVKIGKIPAAESNSAALPQFLPRGGIGCGRGWERVRLKIPGLAPQRRKRVRRNVAPGVVPRSESFPEGEPSPPIETQRVVGAKSDRLLVFVGSDSDDDERGAIGGGIDVMHVDSMRPHLSDILQRAQLPY